MIVNNKKESLVKSPFQGPELAPLFDVMFIILVFLLLTANSKLLTLPVELVATDNLHQEISTEHKPIILSITANPSYWGIDEHAYQNWHNFKQALLQQTITFPKRSLLINVDKAATAESLLQLLSLLQQHQFANTKIIMQKIKK